MPVELTAVLSFPAEMRSAELEEMRIVGDTGAEERCSSEVRIDILSSKWILFPGIPIVAAARTVEVTTCKCVRDVFPPFMRIRDRLDLAEEAEL